MLYTCVKSYTVPNGVLFIYDQSENLVVPDDTGASAIQVTKNCLSIWTIGEYDGEVDIILTDDGRRAVGEMVFSGHIQTSSQILSINRSDTNVICEISVASSITELRIFAENFPYATRVTCIVA